MPRDDTGAEQGEPKRDRATTLFIIAALAALTLTLLLSVIVGRLLTAILVAMVP